MADPVAKTPVTFEDGRIVEFSAKQRLSKESTIDEATGEVVVRLDFRNGASRSFAIPKELLLRFAAHGAEQKLGDSIAGETDADDAVLAVEELIAQLEKGEWLAKRASGAFTGTSILLRALVEVSGKTPEVIKTYLESKSQAEKIALRKSSQLQPVIARLEAEKNSKSKSIACVNKPASHCAVVCRKRARPSHTNSTSRATKAISPSDFSRMASPAKCSSRWPRKVRPLAG